MHEETVTTTASSTQAQCAALREQNERLRRENEMLKKKFEEERALRQSWELDENGGGGVTLQTLTYKRKIEEMAPRADVLALHDELQQLRQKCTVYAEALEESRGYFFEMKRLYAELEMLQRKSPAAAQRGGPSQRSAPVEEAAAVSSPTANGE